MKRASIQMQQERGYSLLEVLVASVVIVVVCLSFILTLTYANRAATLSTLQLSAAQLLQGEVERIRSDRYENIEKVNYPDRLATSTNKVYLDTEKRVPVTLTYDFLTTFPVTSANISSSPNSVTVKNIPTNTFRSGSFINDELTSNIVVVCDGTGATQRGLIRSNNANTIYFTGDTTGKTNVSWTVKPDATSVIQLNMGKIVTVRVSWSAGRRTYTEEMRTLVVLPLDL